MAVLLVKKGRYMLYNDCRKIVILEVRKASRYLKDKKNPNYLFQYFILDNNHKISTEYFQYKANQEEIDISLIPDNLNLNINKDFASAGLLTIANMYFDLSHINQKNKKIFQEVQDTIQASIETPLAYKRIMPYNKGVCSDIELKNIFKSLQELEKVNLKKTSR